MRSVLLNTKRKINCVNWLERTRLEIEFHGPLTLKPEKIHEASKDPKLASHF